MLEYSTLGVVITLIDAAQVDFQLAQRFPIEPSRPDPLHAVTVGAEHDHVVKLVLLHSGIVLDMFDVQR
ncbi:hypothetical protein HMPREF3086_03880 [Dietzia sp. HMSC21D01]|nr:hypothetical protein HMPREF3086_03880 [Dietzia sp. HMSC21D01]